MFRVKVRKFYKTFYDKNDKAHMIDHADMVVDGLLKLNESYKYDNELVILTGYIHDIFTGVDRENHHTLAYEYVINRSDKFLKALSHIEIELIAGAVLRHRASYTGEYVSTLDVMMSTADKGKLVFIDVVKRSLKYHSEDVDKVENVYKHLKEKFGKNGYAKYSKMYLDLYGEELKIFNKKVDNLTLHMLRDIVKEIEE